MISFIIPSRNEEKVIEKILRCVCRYTGPKEIIVSDGGSSDKTIAIARRYADKVIVHQDTKRQTIAGGRNAGAAVATGDFFVFLDSDDYIKDTNYFFTKALSRFENDKKLIGLTVALRVLPEMETLADRIIFKFMNFLSYFYNNIIHYCGAPGEFQMVRAEAFKQVNGYDERLVASEDYDFFRRIGKIGKARYDGSLTIYHTGRHAHKLGWPKLLWIWWKNFSSVIFLKKSFSAEWEEIR